MNLNDLWGDLTDISARTEALAYMRWYVCGNSFIEERSTPCTLDPSLDRNPKAETRWLLWWCGQRCQERGKWAYTRTSDQRVYQPAWELATHLHLCCQGEGTNPPPSLLETCTQCNNSMPAKHSNIDVILACSPARLKSTECKTKMPVTALWGLGLNTVRWLYMALKFG